METVRCSEIHGGDCDFVAEGATKEEALHRLAEHEESVHRDDINALTPEQQAEREKLKRAHMKVPMHTRDLEEEKRNAVE